MLLSQLSSLSPASAARSLLAQRCQAPAVSRLVATSAPRSLQRSVLAKDFQSGAFLVPTEGVVARDDHDQLVSWSADQLLQQRLTAAINAIWPATSDAAVNKASRVAALHLSAASGYRDTKSKVANAIVRAHTSGTPTSEAVEAFKTHLPGNSLTAFLQNDKFFQLAPEERPFAGAIVTLDVRALLAAAGNLPTQPVLAAAGPKLLSYVRNRRWHDDKQLNVARRAVAEHILTTVNSPWMALDPEKYCMICDNAGELIQKALQDRLGWKPGDARSYRSMSRAMSGDPYLSTYLSKPSEMSIKLDIVALLTDAIAAPAQDICQQDMMGSTVCVSSSDKDSAAPSEPLQQLHQLSEHDRALTQQQAASNAATSPNPEPVMSAHNSRRSLFGEQRSDAVAVPSSKSFVSFLELQHHGGGWYLPVYNPQRSTSSPADNEEQIKLNATHNTADEFVASTVELLPDSLQFALQDYISTAAGAPTLEEIMADSGHPVQIKLSDHSVLELPVTLDIPDALNRLAAARQGLEEDNNNNSSSSSSSSNMLDSVLASLQTTPGSAYDGMFGSDNRMGIPGTLHRVSAMRDRKGGIIGLTYRVGRHVPGVALMVADILSSMKASIRSSQADRPQSLLLLGRPGVGKTTLLRDIARIMSLPVTEGGLGLAVIVVDTSNEIAGDAAQRHPCIGRARRMMVPRRDQQAAVLVEAVQNHGPDVIIVDEIGTAQEVEAARTIAQRGVLLVGTAHGGALGNLLKNPELRSLVGGVHAVTVGDAMAQATNFGQKTKLERVGPATFVTLLELQQKNRWRLHLEVEQSVDILLGAPGTTLPGAAKMVELFTVNTQARSRLEGSLQFQVVFETAAAAQQASAAAADLGRAAGRTGDEVAAHLEHS